MNYKSTEADMNRVIDTIVLGFSIDPIVRWLFSEPMPFWPIFPPC
jgi:hypothetical protein